MVYTIAAARLSDLPRFAAIELAAGTLLTGSAPASVLAETTSRAELEDAQRRGHLWVALADDVPVGFAHVKVLEPGIAHLEELDVHPEHGRRGLGTRLVLAVSRWAATNGFSCVTLTTFRDVPWNMPFYAQLGFEEIPQDELSPALRSAIEDETRRGLDPTRRAAMRRPCEPKGRGFVQAQTMGNPEFVISTEPAPVEVQYLEDRLYEFNSAATGITDGEWLAIVVRDDDERIVAGICGNTWGGYAEIRQFWVEEARRKQGLGTRLLEAAAQEALRRGCRHMLLMTFSFQAPAFYAKRGFEVLAVVDDHPQGHTNMLLRKRLASADS